MQIYLTLTNYSMSTRSNSKNKMLINFESVCRCCLRSDSLKSIFSEMITKTTVGYDKMIESVCSLTVSKHDGLSSQICSRCIRELNASYKFRQKCIESFTEVKKLKEQICPTIKLEPKLEQIEFKFELIEASSSNHIEQLLIRNNDFDSERDNNEKFEILCDVLNIDTKNEINENEQTLPEVETKVEVDTIIEDPVTSKIQEENIKKERKLCDKNKATSDVSQESKIKKCNGKLTCDICGKTYLMLKRLQDHINWVHQGIKPYHCPICNKDFMNGKLHQNTHRDFNATCDKCGQKFTRQQTYKRHLEKHGNNEYKCICGKIFKVRTSFLTHKRNVHGPKRYTCHICAKTLTSRGSLNDHIRNHSGERPYKCEFCVMTFRTNKVLIGHVKMKHSNVRPYKCQQCNKDFKTQSILLKHKFIHEKRRFACRICEQPFGRRDNRNVHERSVHGIVKLEDNTSRPA